MWPMLAMMVVGTISSAEGAKQSAASQRLSIEAQQQADMYTAQSASLAMNSQAGLELLNAQANYHASLVSADFEKIGAQTGAQLDAMTAVHDATLRDITTQQQAGTAVANAGIARSRAEAATWGAEAAMAGAEAAAAGAEAGAQISESRAALLELQAQSAMRRGEYQEQDTRLQYAVAKSKAKTRMAAGNIDLGQGAALQVQVSHDVMAENAAIRIQQDAMLQAYGMRVNASSELIGAAANRMAAGAKLQAAKASFAAAKVSIAGANLEAGLMESNAQFATSMSKANLSYTESRAETNVDYVTAMSDAQYNATKALADAGLINANASVNYKHTMADVMVKNASVASMIKQIMGDGISPSLAYNTAMIGGASQVASSWYMYSKTGGGGGADSYRANLQQASQQYAWD